jgi:hypothetical protein
VRHRISRLLAAGFFLSLLFHFGIAPLVVWLLGYKPATPKSEVVYVATSSSIRHAPRPRPRVARPIERPQPQPPKPVPQTRPQQQKPQPQHQEVKREIARIDRRSVHPPPAHAVALNSAMQQQQMFERTIARLREQNNPVISAARTTVKPQAPKRFSFDFSGSVGTAPTAEGILTPERSWRDGQYDYYYVRYWVQYADGSTETGIVPWPLRYRPADDPFRLGLEHFPLPGPMPDYILPAGTNLHPLVALCYKHRAEFPNCPIEHD